MDDEPIPHMSLTHRYRGSPDRGRCYLCDRPAVDRQPIDGREQLLCAWCAADFTPPVAQRATIGTSPPR